MIHPCQLDETFSYMTWPSKLYVELEVSTIRPHTYIYNIFKYYCMIYCIPRRSRIPDCWNSSLPKERKLSHTRVPLIHPTKKAWPSIGLWPIHLKITWIRLTQGCNVGWIRGTYAIIPSLSTDVSFSIKLIHPNASLLFHVDPLGNKTWGIIRVQITL